MGRALLDDFAGDKFAPFRIEASDSETGFRIGGRAPHGVVPPFCGTHTRYLLTVPICDGVEASVFHSFDFESDGDDNPFNMAHKMIDQDNPLIQVCLHGCSRRSDNEQIGSDIPGRRLFLIDSEVLEKPYEDFESYPFHKLGGSPYFVREFDSGISEEANRLIRFGFVQLIQLAFPVGPGDAVIDADWPFGDASFHILAESRDKGLTYRYCWG